MLVDCWWWVDDGGDEMVRWGADLTVFWCVRE